CGVLDSVVYVVSQIAGAFLAAWEVDAVTTTALVLAPAPEATTAAILLMEFLFTFLLMLVILNVAVSAKTTKNSYYGLAIGITVTAGAYAAGGISGAALNPAVGVGPLVYLVFVGKSLAAHWWMYVLAPLAGALAADIVFYFQEGTTIPVDQFLVEREARDVTPVGDAAQRAGATQA
ncbi:MAG: aquaporin, partial [Phycisphaerae bacterium]